MGTSLDYDTIRKLVPDLDELKALLDAVLGASRPDRDETWTGTGELGTVGARELDASTVPELARRAAEREVSRIQAVYGTVAAALQSAIDGDLAGAGDAMLEAAAVEERSGRARQAAAFAEAALALARTRGDPRAVSLALRRQARAERTLGRLDLSLRHYEDAARAAESGADRPGEAEATIGAGNVLEQQGRWSDAETWYRSALEILQALEPPTPAHWHARLNMHIILRSRGDVAESEPWLDEAESVAAALGDPARHAFLGNARGQLLMAQDDPDGAEAHFFEALQRADRGRASATIRLNLAECHLARERTLDATEQAREAERDVLARTATDKLPEVYRMLGRAAAAAGNPDAFVLFERALELAGDQPGPLLLERAQTLQAYGDAEHALGQRRTAEDLWGQARTAYEQLGIAGFRRAWSDCFDAPIPSLDSTEASS